MYKNTVSGLVPWYKVWLLILESMQPLWGNFRTLDNRMKPMWTSASAWIFVWIVSSLKWETETVLKIQCWNVHRTRSMGYWNVDFNPLNPELNPICYLLAVLGAHHFLHVSRIRVKSLTLRLLMSYIYGAPILDVSRSHTTTQHSR